MNVYLPIAEITVDIWFIIGLGILGGFFSGLLGIGGGVLMMPGLTFLGISPEIAVASQVNQVLATSVSGSLAYWHRRCIDHKILSLLLIGGILGTTGGLYAVAILQKHHYLQEVIIGGYSLLLPLLAISILWNCWKRTKEISEPSEDSHPPQRWQWCDRLPGQAFFPQSQISISFCFPVGLGIVSGILVAVLGIGGGIIMVPAMIYGMGMPNRLATGTSLAQIVFVALFLTVSHIVLHHSVDIVLSGLLTVGGVLGAQAGARMGFYIRDFYLRILLAMVMLLSAFKLWFSSPSVLSVPRLVAAQECFISPSCYINNLTNMAIDHPLLYSTIAILGAFLIGVGADKAFHKAFHRAYKN